MSLFFNIANWIDEVKSTLSQEEFLHLKEVIDSANEIDVAPKTILLEEGKTATKAYFIKQGSLRLWLNDKGRDITFQFFFKGGTVASFESLLKQEPSCFYLETIEPCKLLVFDIVTIETVLRQIPNLYPIWTKMMMSRLTAYRDMFISRITLSPQERYEELMQMYPEIFLRVPQHLIASYLGITSVSLSRIRARQK